MRLKIARARTTASNNPPIANQIPKTPMIVKKNSAPTRVGTRRPSAFEKVIERDLNIRGVLLSPSAKHRAGELDLALS
jgi:hypothetical protein